MKQAALMNDDNVIEINGFRYDQLTADVREFVMMKEESIKSRTIRAIVETGRDLSEVKEKLGHGQFQIWLRTAFDMSVRTAQNYMQIFREFKDAPDYIENFSRKALTLLASRNMPEAVRADALELASTGEIIDENKIMELKAQLEELKKYSDKEINKQKERYRDLSGRYDIMRNDLQKTHLEKEKIKSEKIIKEVKEIIPDDYYSLKNKAKNYEMQAEQALKESDNLRREIEEERKNFENIKKKSQFAKDISRLESGIEMICSSIGYNKITEYDVPFLFQDKVDRVVRFLISVSSGIGENIQKTNKDSRDKLLKAGYLLIRPDEETLTIKNYTDKGSWAKYRDCENRREFRTVLKELLSDENIIIA